MKIIKTCCLDEGQKSEIRELEAAAYRPEGLENTAFLENTLNFDHSVPCFYLGYEEERLIAFLTAFFPDREDGEITAFTHPDFRRRGCFSALYREAEWELKAAGVGRAVFAMEPKSRSGAAVLERFPKAAWLRSEYRMIHDPEPVPLLRKGLTVLPLTRETKAAYCGVVREVYGHEEDGLADAVMESESRRGFLLCDNGEPVGVFSEETDAERVFLYGVGVSAEKRNRGYGREIVNCALRQGAEQKKLVVLDVDSDNPPALHLYRACGFRETFQVDYYACPFSDK